MSSGDLITIIDALRRQRVRQDDFDSVLALIVNQAGVIGAQWPTGPLARIAYEMNSRVLEIRRLKRSSVPKFVVEDLLDESIRQLQEQARANG